MTDDIDDFGGMIPDAPPPEVLAALDAAAQVLRDLRRKQLSLRLRVEESGTTKRIRVEVHEHTSAFLREIAPRDLLDLLAGNAPPCGEHGGQRNRSKGGTLRPG